VRLRLKLKLKLKADRGFRFRFRPELEPELELELHPNPNPNPLAASAIGTAFSCATKRRCTMTGQAYWLTPVLVLMGGVGIILLIAILGRVRDFLLTEDETFTCPLSHHRVHCRLLEDVRTDEWAKVERCDGPTRRCHCECVLEHNRNVLHHAHA
jgi:hypothetical protein